MIKPNNVKQENEEKHNSSKEKKIIVGTKGKGSIFILNRKEPINNTKNNT